MKLLKGYDDAYEAYNLINTPNESIEIEKTE